MKKFVLAQVLLILLFSPLFCLAQNKKNPQTIGNFEDPRFHTGSYRSTNADENFFYNGAGQQVGRSETDQSDNQERYYNSTGSYRGYSRQNEDNLTQYYDKKGMYTGYDLQDGNIIRHYSDKGEYLGYSINQDGVTLQYDNQKGYQGKSINLNE